MGVESVEGDVWAEWWDLERAVGERESERGPELMTDGGWGEEEEEMRGGGKGPHREEDICRKASEQGWRRRRGWWVCVPNGEGTSRGVGGREGAAEVGGQGEPEAADRTCQATASAQDASPASVVCLE